MQFLLKGSVVGLYWIFLIETDSRLIRTIYLSFISSSLEGVHVCACVCVCVCVCVSGCVRGARAKTFFNNNGLWPDSSWLCHVDILMYVIVWEAPHNIEFQEQ